MSVLIAIMLTAAAPSEAEVGTWSTPEARKGLQGFGRCMVIEHPVDVRALLATDYRDKSYARRMQNLLRRRADCPGIEIPSGAYSSGRLLWGGALAEELMRRDKILDQFAARTAYRAELPVIEARNADEYIAFCVVRANPAATAALFRTEVATAEELAALKALGSTVSGCLPKGSKAEFTRDSLRALLALGAYRLALHNRQSALANTERG